MIVGQGLDYCDVGHNKGDYLWAYFDGKIHVTEAQDEWYYHTSSENRDGWYIPEHCEYTGRYDVKEHIITSARTNLPSYLVKLLYRTFPEAKEIMEF